MRAALCLLLLLPGSPVAAACWRADPAASDVQFIATQAGAPIEGTFRRFDGRVCLDAASPGQDIVAVTVETASVDMGIPEFDAEMRGPLFFDSARWPAARFESTGIRLLGPGRYAVTGRFTLRDRTRIIEAPFTLAEVPGGAVISGDIALQRLDYDIGLGEWRDTRWVGNEVLLRFRVALTSE